MRTAFFRTHPQCAWVEAAIHYMRLTTTALLSLALAGCGGSGASFDSSTGTDREFAQCSAGDIKATVLEHMQDFYLFYDQVPNINANDFATPEEYIQALRVSPFDRFSYVTEQSTSEALFEEGKRFGFGIRMRYSDAQRLFFTLVEPLSPFGLANAERGDEILAINGVSIDNLTNDFVNDAFGESDEAIDITFTLVKRDSGAEVDITVTKALYDVQTVLDTNIVEHNDHRVGYLSFLSFLETSEAELDDAFATLKEENVDELVLDLRHNGGGRISVAEAMGSLIAGSFVEDTSFTRFAFNDQYSHKDSSVTFQARSNALDLDRVYVLTSPATCSASEMVINSLAPFIDVVTIGGSTCGKPYGTISRDECGKSINILEVEFLNAANVGGYYDGISADCPIAEDFSQPQGVVSENLFSAALYHLDTAQCQVAIAADSTNATSRSSIATAKMAPVPNIEPLNPDFDEIRPLLRN